VYRIINFIEPHFLVILFKRHLMMYSHMPQSNLMIKCYISIHFLLIYKQSNDDFGVFIKRVSYLKIVSLTTSLNYGFSG